MKSRFCPECGSSGKSFVRHLCIDCYLKKHSPVSFEREFSLPVCRDCAKHLVKGKWQSFSDAFLKSLFESRIKTKDLLSPVFLLDILPHKTAGWVAKGIVSGQLHGEPVSVPVWMHFKPALSLCSDCSKLHADYYEAKVQFRFGSSDKKAQQEILSKFSDRIESMFASDSKSVVVRESVLRNGVDLYVGSKRSAKIAVDELAVQFGIRPVRSSSLVGVDKNGHERKHYTFLMRF